MSVFYDRGKRLVHEAVTHDERRAYSKATMCYIRASEVLIKGLKYDVNPTSKRLVQQRVSGYLSRAEQLRALPSFAAFEAVFPVPPKIIDQRMVRDWSTSALQLVRAEFGHAAAVQDSPFG